MSARPYRLTAEDKPEDELQHAVARALDILLLPPAVWFPLPIGHVALSPAQAARFSRIGVKRGLPDLLVCHRRIYGIELKRVGGRLSRTRTVRTRSGAQRVLDGQEDVFPKLMAAGMEIAVCTSVDEVLERLVAWDVPLRAARWAA